MFAVSASDTVVDDLDHDDIVVPGDLDAGSARVGMLADVRNALRDDIKRGHFDLLGQATIESDSKAQRDRRSGGDRLQSDLQTMPAQHGGMEAARDGAKLLERDSNLVSRLIETRARVLIAGDLLLEQAELERERDQPLLGTVVQVALQSLPLPLSRLDHASARSLQLLQMRLLFGLQACILERNASCRRYRAQQLGLVVEGRIVDECGDVLSVLVDQGRRVGRRLVRQLDRLAFEIRVCSELGKP